MSKIVSLNARLTTNNMSNNETETLVKKALQGIDGVLLLGNLKITNLNPAQARIIRASLDLMLQKSNETDEAAEEHLSAYSLGTSDIDEKTISETINALFP